MTTPGGEAGQAALKPANSTGVGSARSGPYTTDTPRRTPLRGSLLPCPLSSARSRPPRTVLKLAPSAWGPRLPPRHLAAALARLPPAAHSGKGPGAQPKIAG